MWDQARRRIASLLGPLEKEVDMNETLPCGCVAQTDVIDGIPTFLLVPCALDCPYFQYVVDESQRQGKPVTTIDAR